MGRPPSTASTRVAPVLPELERRSFLRGLALLAGGALTPACASFVREGARPQPPSRRILSADERAALAAATDAVIPATDTPGAVEAGVPEFIEMMLVDWFHEEEREVFRAGLARLDPLARQHGAPSFAAAEPAVRDAVLAQLEREAAAAAPPGPGAGPTLLPGLGGPPSGPPPAFFTALKELCVVGYYTSEIGATRELRRRVAGDFAPCLPLAELGRAWSE